MKFSHRFLLLNNPQFLVSAVNEFVTWVAQIMKNIFEVLHTCRHTSYVLPLYERDKLEDLKVGEVPLLVFDIRLLSFIEFEVFIRTMLQ